MARNYHLGPARRAVNVVVTAMLRIGLGPTSAYLLTTTGRTTGRPRTTPVVVIQTDGRWWLVSPYGNVGWVNNVRSRPEVSLRRGRTTRVLHAEEAGAETAGPILQRYLRPQAPITAPFFDAGPDDPAAAFVAEADRHPVFEVSAVRGGT